MASHVKVAAPARGCTSTKIASFTPSNSMALPTGASMTCGSPRTVVAWPPVRSRRSNVQVTTSSAARSDTQTRITAAAARRDLMPSRARLYSAAIVILLAVFAETPASQARNYKPVTDAMLLNPDPADWPSWRRTLDGWGYSPLTQINTQNAHQLQLPWSGTIAPRLRE